MVGAEACEGGREHGLLLSVRYGGGGGGGEEEGERPVASQWVR